MPRMIFLAAALFLVSASAPAQQNAGEILDGVIAQYESVHDYQVQISATINMKGLSVPPMNATMYFRKPDKVQLKSDGFAMLPRDAVGFNPAMFNKNDYDLVMQGSERIRSVECVKVKMLAKSDTLRLQRAMIYVDSKRSLIMRMDFDPGTGSSATADFTYERVDGKYSLPSRIDIEMDSPMHMQRPGQKSTSADKSKGGKARITMKYHGYMVNKGIPDSVFEANDAAAAPHGRN